MRVEEKHFTNGSDRDFVRRKYQETHDEVVGPVKRFDLFNVAQATSQDWEEFLLEVLPTCHDLEFVNLAENEAIGGDLDGESRARERQGRGRGELCRVVDVLSIESCRSPTHSLLLLLPQATATPGRPRRRAPPRQPGSR